jgi:hypothetical protein
MTPFFRLDFQIPAEFFIIRSEAFSQGHLWKSKLTTQEVVLYFYSNSLGTLEGWGIYSIEFLCDRHQVSTDRPKLYALPFKTFGAERAPARVIAVIPYPSVGSTPEGLIPFYLKETDHWKQP